MSESKFWKPFTQMKTAPASLEVKGGKGVWLELSDGKKLMDAISSWWVTLHGHSQPEIADAIHRQALTLEQVIPAGFTHGPAEELAEKLLSKLPEALNWCFYSDDGSTAVEVGLKMALQHWYNKGETKRTKFFAFEGAYHGDTAGAMSVAERSVFNAPFAPMLFDVTHLPFPETWMGDEAVEEKEAAVFSMLDALLEKEGDAYAGIMLEPLIQGAGGMRFCRPEFLQELERKMKAHGILVIYDEVMTGFGRTGEWFACLAAGTTPDIVCVSKGITGGFLPLAATFATDHVYSAFHSDNPEHTFFHGHSYCANPLGCAAGLASFALLEAEPFRKIDAWHKAFLPMLEAVPRIRKIRQRGTICAMEIETEGEGGYLDAIGPKLKVRFPEEGVLLRPLGNVLYILPPYCITKEELRSVYATICKVVGEL